MTPIFTLEKREKIKTQLLEIGIVLIKEKGIKKMTIDEVAEQAGIGKGTFYHFFLSKESFVLNVIQFSKENIYRCINDIIAEKGSIDRESFKELLERFTMSGSNNIISFMTQEDEEWLMKKLPNETALNPQKEDRLMGTIFQYIIGKRENINYHVVANIMKIMGIAVENRELLHQDALEENIRLLQQQLCDYIFKKGEKDDEL